MRLLITAFIATLIVIPLCYMNSSYGASHTNNPPPETKRIPLTGETSPSMLDQAINMEGITEGKKLQRQGGTIIIEKENGKTDDATIKNKPQKSPSSENSAP